METKLTKKYGLITAICMVVGIVVGSVFMVYACIDAHRIACVWYLIVFAVVMLIGWLLKDKQTATPSAE